MVHFTRSGGVRGGRGGFHPCWIDGWRPGRYNDVTHPPVPEVLMLGALTTLHVYQLIGEVQVQVLWRLL